MALFGVRYDLRCPDFGPCDSAGLAQAAIEQSAWADERGFITVTLSEHHGSPDGYMPSPLVLGGAIAARTKNIRITLAAMIAPLHDPVRLAEDLAMLDVISGGRVIPIVSGGYVESEFATFGRKLSDRKQIMDEIVPFLEKAWTGEPFEWKGRTVRVTPRPVQQPRPPILMGGASKAAARRAARHADGFMPTQPEFYAEYLAECEKLGKPAMPQSESPFSNFLHVAEDPDAAWAKIAPHAMHEMNAYGAWAAASGANTGYRPIEDADALRATGQYPVLTPDELVARLRELPPATVVNFHPLMGGLDPEVAWESLELVAAKVIPALAES